MSLIRFIRVNLDKLNLYKFKKIFVIFLILIIPLTIRNDLIKAQKIINTIDVGNTPRGIAVNPNTNLIYVTNMNDDSVSVIDGVTNKIIDNITVGGRPLGIAVNPETNSIYVGDADGISVIDGLANMVVATIPFESSFDDFPVPEPPPSDPSVPGFGEVFTRANMIEINPVENKIYLACGCSGNVLVIDGFLNERIYITRGAVNSSVVIDGDSNNIIATTESRTDIGSNVVGVNIETNHIFIANLDGSITVVDGFTNEIVTTLNGGGHRSAKITVNHKTNLVYLLSIDSSDPELEKVTIIKDEFVNTDLSSTLLRADFFAKPQSDFNVCCNGIRGNPPLTAEFVNLSTGDPGNLLWEFGDGETSTNKDVSHVYDEFGVFSVMLTVSNSTEISIREKQFLINSFPPTPPQSNPGAIPTPVSTPILTVTPTITSIATLTPISTPTPTATPTVPSILPVLSVSPSSSNSSLRLKEATVIVNDQNGKLQSDIIVTATVIGFGTVVTPVSQITDNDGTAKFQFRFGFSKDKGTIIFSANEMTDSIIQE